MVDKNNKESGIFGKYAENLASEYLITQGYTIRERNWRMNHLEVDIIAQKAETIVFVEVKARKGNFLDPLDAVDEKKMKRIANAANVYMNHLEYAMDARFDIITVVGDMESNTLEHIEDAFIPSLRSY